MTRTVNLSSMEFRSSLTPERLRPGFIAYIGLIVGPLLFLAFPLTLSPESQGQMPHPESLSFLRIFTAFALVAFTGLAFLSQVMFKRMFSPEKISAILSDQFMSPNNRISSSDPAEKALLTIRSALIVRMALLEASAWWGLIGLQLAAMKAMLYSSPWVWVNLIPLASVILLATRTFPTADKLQQIFETYIEQH